MQNIKGGSQIREFLLNEFSLAFHRHLQETNMFPFTFSSDCPCRQDENVVATVEYSLLQITRRILSQLDVPCMSVWKALNFIGLYPHDIHPIKHIESWEYDVRLQFCRWIDPDLELYPLILFTGEAQCTCDGMNNMHNTYSLCPENSLDTTVYQNIG
jgi:hypothetical protein